MFNGIIKKTGKIYSIKKKEKNCLIEIYSKIKFSKNEIGSSISCSGVCLSLENFNANLSRYYLSNETLNKTNLKKKDIGDIVNLEKSLKYGNRLSGHFVQGHIDTTGIVMNIKFVGKSCFINFKILNIYRKNLIYKGSIAINGVSLTVSKILPYGFQTVVIPQTLKLTDLMFLKKNYEIFKN